MGAIPAGAPAWPQDGLVGGQVGPELASRSDFGGQVEAKLAPRSALGRPSWLQVGSKIGFLEVCDGKLMLSYVRSPKSKNHNNFSVETFPYVGVENP